MAATLDTTFTSGWTLVTDTTSDYSLVGDKPSALVENDYILAYVAVRAGGSTTEITFTPAADFNVIHQEEAPGTTRPLFWIGVKKATASEPSTYTFTGAVTAGTATHAQLILQRVTTADLTTFLDVAASQTGGSSVSAVSPSVDTATADALVISMIAGNNGNNLTDPDLNQPGSMTCSMLRTSAASSSGVISGIAFEVQASPGATGTKTWTNCFSGSTAYQGVTFAIKAGAASTNSLAWIIA